MADSVNFIDEKQLDVFKEIGNIGAGNAATALAGILNRTIDMSIPDAQVVPFNSIVNVLDGPETLVVGVLVDVSGDLNGYILLVLKLEDAMQMVSLAMGEVGVSGTEALDLSLSDIARDTLLEISNIIVGSFLSAISSMSKLKAVPSVPQMATDMLGAIISIAAIEYGTIGDSVLFLKTKFTNTESDISGHFFLIPDYKSYKILIESLGL